MMEKALTGQTGGSVTVDYAASGLRYSFTAPVEQMTA
jgi:hypothetical protein